MGRTLATASQIILTEEQALKDFRRALRKPQQQAFDDLFSNARKQVAAITMASNALPFETVLLAMLVEEHTEVQRLREEVSILNCRLDSLLGKGE